MFQRTPAETVSYSPMELETATDHAVIALLWSETIWEPTGPDYTTPGPNDGEPMDSQYTPADVAPQSVAALWAELSAFVAATDAEYTDAFQGVTPEQLGHDFILTRNGHGVGFWDRGRGEAGDALTAMCKPFGSISAYRADTGPSAGSVIIGQG